MQGHKSLHHMLRAIPAPLVHCSGPHPQGKRFVRGETEKMNEKILLLNPLNVTGQKRERERERVKGERKKGTSKTEVRMLFLVVAY